MQAIAWCVTRLSLVPNGSSMEKEDRLANGMEPAAWCERESSTSDTK